MATLEELMAKIPVSTENAIVKPKTVEELMGEMGLKGKSFSTDYSRVEDISKQMAEIKYKSDILKQKSAQTQKNIDSGIQELKTPVEEKSAFQNAIQYIGNTLGSALTTVAGSMNPLVLLDNAYAIKKKFDDTIIYELQIAGSTLTGGLIPMPTSEPVVKTLTKDISDYYKRYGGKDIDTSKINNQDIKYAIEKWNQGINPFVATIQDVNSYFQGRTDEVSDKVGYGTKLLSQVLGTVPQLALLVSTGGLGTLAYATSAYNSAVTNEIDKQGEISDSNLDYALLSATVDVVSESVFSLAKGNLSLYKGALEQQGKLLKNATVGELAWGIVKQGAEEGSEELIAYPFQMALDWKYKNPDASIEDYANWKTVQKWAEAGLVGFLAGGLMSTVPAIQQARYSNKEQKQAQEYLKNVIFEKSQDISQETLDLFLDSAVKAKIPVTIPTETTTAPAVQLKQTTAQLMQEIMSLKQKIDTPSVKQEIVATKTVSASTVKKELPIEQRISGDSLLNAKDLIADIKSNKGIVDSNGYVTLYHRTSKENANKILSEKMMSAKEDGVFFSTSKDGMIKDFGDTTIEFKVPAEKLALDDVFGTEAHLRFALKNKNQKLYVSDYIVSGMPSTAQKAQKPTSVSKDVKVPVKESKAVKKAPSESQKKQISIEDIAKKKKANIDIEQDIETWLETSDEASDIRNIKTEEQYIEKVSELNEQLNEPNLTSEKIGKINLQLFALKKWEDRISQVVKGKNISLYVQHMIEALRSESTDEVKREIEMGLKQSDLFHSILTNEKTIAKATKKFETGKTRYLEEIEKKFLDKDYIPTPDELVSISLYAKQLLAENNVVRAENLAVMTGRRLTKAGQTIQAASLLKRVFPEYQAQRIIKELQDTIPFEQNRVLTDESETTQDILNKARKQAADDAVKEITKDKNELHVRLLNLILKKTIAHEKYLEKDAPQKVRELSEESKILRALFRKFTDELPARDERQQTRLYDFVQDIIINRNTYDRTWKLAQEAGRTNEMFVESDTYRFLEMLADPIVAKSFLRTLISQKLKDTGDSVSNFAKTYFLTGAESYDGFVDSLLSSMPRMDKESADYLRTYMRETFTDMMDRQRARAIESLKKQVERRKNWKKQVETQEIIVGKLMDIAYKDAFSIDEIRSEWSKRLGVMDITSEMKQDIYKTMRDIAKESDEDKKDRLYDSLVTRLSKNIKGTTYEKAVAIIRFSLLMRPKSLIRNMMSNFAMVPMYGLSDRMANRIMRKLRVDRSEMISAEQFKRFDPDTDIGKTVLQKTSRDALDRFLLQSEKYSMGKILGREKRIFSNESVDNIINKMPGRALNEGEIGKLKIAPLGDIYMFTKHFRSAMYNKLLSLGYSDILSAEKKSDMISAAMNYANEIATRRVFRELNMASRLIMNISKVNQKTVNDLRAKGKYAEARTLEISQNVFKAFVQSVYRFFVTPAAIGAEVYRFSPVALAVTIGKDFLGAKITGTWTESQQRALFAKKFSQAFTGTVTTYAVGFLLAMLGFVNAEAPEDEKERRIWELDGRKAWSLYIPGVGSFSIDWLQPIAGPFMLGASFYNAVFKDGITADSIKKMADNGIDVLLNLSILNNIQQTFGDKYGTTTDKITDFMLSTGYQFLPTFIIDLNKVIDPYVRNPYSGTAVENIFYKIMSAVPFGSYAVPVKTDLWGRPVRSAKSEGVLAIGERIVLNLLSPFTTSFANMDSVTKEVTRVFNETNDTGALPSIPTNKITYPKSGNSASFEYTMSGKEYEAFRIAVGDLYYKSIQDYIKSTEYKYSSDGSKVSDEIHANNFSKMYKAARDTVAERFRKKNPKKQ